MNAQDDRGGQQGSMGSQQQGGGSQSGDQAQQRSTASGQQGGQSTSATSQQGSQQEAYSPGSSGQQGGSLGRRGGSGMPSLFGTRSNPFDMLRRLDEDVDRLFQQIWGGGRNLMRGRGGESQALWVPQVEVREEGGKLHVYADLPGLKKEDVKLSMDGDQLVLQGERQSSREEGQQGSSFYHTERSYGSFYRTIPLPEGVDPQTAQASFKDGVLDVAFDAPRRPQAQSRQIEIR